jgi:hypothetical protein
MFADPAKVARRRDIFAWRSSDEIAGSAEPINITPCFKAELIDSVSSFGTPRPPSLLPLYIKPFGVLADRCRKSLI